MVGKERIDKGYQSELSFALSHARALIRTLFRLLGAQKAIISLFVHQRFKAPAILFTV